MATQRKDQQQFLFRLDAPVGKKLRVKLSHEGVKLQMVVETLVKGWLANVIDLSEVRRKLMEIEAKDEDADSPE